MHIGVLTHNYPRFAGDFSGIFVERLCQELALQDQQVTVWAPYDPAYNRASSEEIIDLRLYRYAWPNRLHRLGYMRTMEADLTLRTEAYLLSPALFAAGVSTILRQAKQMRPDVLHAHWILPNGFIGAIVSRILNIPLVVSVPGSDAQIAAQNSLFRAMTRFAFGQAALLTANSEALRDSIVNMGASLDKFDMIIYGTDPAALYPSNHGVAVLRTELGLADETDVLLCVGRMAPKKGFDVLIRALADPQLATDNFKSSNFKVVMVGEGDHKASWMKLSQELGVAERILWVGNVPKDKISIYYNLADMLIMPSVSRPADGLNVCVLDAMSCGKAVVGSEVAGNQLAIAHGETGLIVPEQNPSALARAIAHLLRNPDIRKKMGAAGRGRIEYELGWPHLARRYIEHFARLSEDKRTGG